MLHFYMSWIEILLMALKQIGTSYHNFPQENVSFDLNDVCQKLKEAVSRGMAFTFSHFPTQILQTDPHSPLKALRENCLSQHHLTHTEVKRGTKNDAFLFSLPLYVSSCRHSHRQIQHTHKKKKKLGRQSSHLYLPRENS